MATALQNILPIEHSSYLVEKKYIRKVLHAFQLNYAVQNYRVCSNLFFFSSFTNNWARLRRFGYKAKHYTYTCEHPTKYSFDIHMFSILCRFTFAHPITIHMLHLQSIQFFFISFLSLTKLQHIDLHSINVCDCWRRHHWWMAEAMVWRAALLLLTDIRELKFPFKNLWNSKVAPFCVLSAVAVAAGCCCFCVRWTTEIQISGARTSLLSLLSFRWHSLAFCVCVICIVCRRVSAGTEKSNRLKTN